MNKNNKTQTFIRCNLVQATPMTRGEDEPEICEWAGPREPVKAKPKKTTKKGA